MLATLSKRCNLKIECMETDQDAITRWITTALPRVETVVGSREAGSPVVAWGDTFFFVGPERRFPFATIVTKDYGDFDNASNLNREGVFRLNIGVGRPTFERLVGSTIDPDYAVFDRILPHPVYAKQRWISILNPSDATFRDVVTPLLVEAHDRLAATLARHATSKG